MSSRFIKISSPDGKVSVILRRSSETYVFVNEIIPLLSSEDQDKLFSAFGEVVLKIKSTIDELPQLPPENQTFISGVREKKPLKFLEREIYYYEGDSIANKLFTFSRVLDIIKMSILMREMPKLEEVSSLSS